LNYNTKDPFANHLMSALAHNTLVVDGQSYQIRQRALDGTEPPPWKMFEQSGLIASQLRAGSDLVRGYNAAYTGVALERTIAFLKPDLVLIYDIAKSDVSHRYTQIFRIGEDLRVARLSTDALLLADPQDQVNVALVQLMGEELDVRSYFGDREKIRGWSARQFDQLVPIPQVEFTKEGSQVEFLTVIGIGQHEAGLRKLAGEIISVAPKEIVLRPAKGDALTVKRGLVREPGATIAD
jgi:hypothetical protein